MTKALDRAEKVKKDDKINFRVNTDLKQRYLRALSVSGMDVTDHLTNKILEFCIQVESSANRKGTITVKEK